MPQGKLRPGRMVISWNKRRNKGMGKVCAPAVQDDLAFMGRILRGKPLPGDRPLAEELEARGYDITTLRITITKLPDAP